jgi:hypothetical protein
MTNPRPKTPAPVNGASNALGEFPGRAAETGRQLGTLMIDAYERAVATFVDFEQRTAEASGNVFVKTAFAAHAGLIDGVNDVYIKAMRASLPR